MLSWIPWRLQSCPVWLWLPMFDTLHRHTSTNWYMWNKDGSQGQILWCNHEVSICAVGAMRSKRVWSDRLWVFRLTSGYSTIAILIPPPSNTSDTLRFAENMYKYGELPRSFHFILRRDFISFHSWNSSKQLKRWWTTVPGAKRMVTGQGAARLHGLITQNKSATGASFPTMKLEQKYAKDKKCWWNARLVVMRTITTLKHAKSTIRQILSIWTSGRKQNTKQLWRQRRKPQLLLLFDKSDPHKVLPHFRI